MRTSEILWQILEYVLAVRKRHCIFA